MDTITSPMHEDVILRAKSWLIPEVDEATRTEIECWMREDQDALREAFYSELEFGTGGLRGVMGVGSMRMNRYTVGMATQGLARYILGQKGRGASVAIAFDSRMRSPEFARTAADVLTANGIRVYLYPQLRPTPLLSYTVRALGCAAGIVITASHNPPEYNGYKVYWEDGGQVLPPHDAGIIAEVRKVRGIADVRFEGDPELLLDVPPEVEERYAQEALSLLHQPEAIARQSGLPIVYSSLHGAGITLIPPVLRRAGFSQVHVVASQEVPDGRFPTVKSPNPEEPEAMKEALELAGQVNARLVMATDPDTDRVGLAIRNEKGELELLNGNQAGSLLVWYELLQWKQKGRLDGHQFIASTVVTSDVFPAMAAHFGVPCHLTLTGFKYIAGVIREWEGRSTFIAGGEESYGYLAGSFVRDKDAVLSALKFAEITAWCADRGTTPWEMLMEIYRTCGLFEDRLVSVTLKGLDGLAKIRLRMQELRGAPPGALDGRRVVRILDFKTGISRSAETGREEPTGLPSSDVLQFVLEDGSRISVRPSGTEPKIKFYFSMQCPMPDSAEYRILSARLRDSMTRIQGELGL